MYKGLKFIHFQTCREFNSALDANYGLKNTECGLIIKIVKFYFSTMR